MPSCKRFRSLLLAVLVAAVACHGESPKSTRREAVPADFEVLVGTWDITYTRESLEGPPLRGTWTWRRDGRAVSEELRLVAAAGAMTFAGITYRIYDPRERDWEVAHVEMSRAGAVVAPYDDVGVRPELVSWRDARGLHLEERSRDSVLRLTISVTGHDLLKCVLELRRPGTGTRDRMKIIAYRTTAVPHSTERDDS